MDMVLKTVWVAFINAIVFIIAVVWDMMNKYWFPPMRDFINGTAATPAGDAFKAQHHLTNISNLGYQLFILCIVGSLIYLVWSAYKDKPQQPPPGQQYYR